MQSATAIGDLPAGFRFGSYVVCGPIGRGGTAHLYRAEHVALGKTVALKVIAPDKLDDPKWRRRFVLEGQAASAVKHPHIVDVTDVGVEGDLPYLVMEYLEGQDLAARLATDGALSEQEMADLLLPVVAALSFAHAAGIVHRDVKPSNIFLARQADGSVVSKLLDFGIAKARSISAESLPDQTDTHQVLGTPLFLPPEALNGSSYLTPLSDQYSFGLVMFHCLTGHSPFEQQTPASLLVAIAAGRLRPLSQCRPNVSRRVEEIVRRATRAEPQARFTDLRELGRALLPVASPRSQVLWEGTFRARVAQSGVRRVRPASPGDDALLLTDDTLSMSELDPLAPVADPTVTQAVHAAGARRWARRAALVACLFASAAALAGAWKYSRRELPGTARSALLPEPAAASAVARPPALSAPPAAASTPAAGTGAPVVAAPPRAAAATPPRARPTGRALSRAPGSRAKPKLSAQREREELEELFSGAARTPQRAALRPRSTPVLE